MRILSHTGGGQRNSIWHARLPIMQSHYPCATLKNGRQRQRSRGQDSQGQEASANGGNGSEVKDQTPAHPQGGRGSKLGVSASDPAESKHGERDREDRNR